MALILTVTVIFILFPSLQLSKLKVVPFQRSDSSPHAHTSTRQPLTPQPSTSPRKLRDSFKLLGRSH